MAYSDTINTHITQTRHLMERRSASMATILRWMLCSCIETPEEYLLARLRYRFISWAIDDADSSLAAQLRQIHRYLSMRLEAYEQTMYLSAEEDIVLARYMIWNRCLREPDRAIAWRMASDRGMLRRWCEPGKSDIYVVIGLRVKCWQTAQDPSSNKPTLTLGPADRPVAVRINRMLDIPEAERDTFAADVPLLDPQLYELRTKIRAPDGAKVPSPTRRHLDLIQSMHDEYTAAALGS